MFAIPANNTFVYIHRLSKDINSVNSYLLSNLHKECTKNSKLITSGTTSSSATPRQRFSYSANRQQQHQQQHQQSNYSNDLNGYDAELFKNFLYQHINVAFKEGFNDNIGRTNIAPTFELPKFSNWVRIYETMHEALFNVKSMLPASLPTMPSYPIGSVNEQKLVNLKTKLLQHIAQIRPYADIDVKFSMNRCKKSLPIALNVYQEGLPQHYTRKQHNAKLDKARHTYSLSARGPMYKKYLKQLENDCLNIWKQGRQLCEAISLTGNSCVNEMHRVENEESASASNIEIQNLPLKIHNSNVITIATSNCGYHQKERIDPFNLKDANYTFYKNFNCEETSVASLSSRSSKMANRKINYFDFPVFKPTETTSLILSSLVAAKSVNEEKEKLLKNSNDLNNEISENLSVNNLSQDAVNNNNNQSIPGDNMDGEDEDNQINNNNNNNDSILSDLFSNKLLINEKDSKQQQPHQQNSPSYTNDLFTTSTENPTTSVAGDNTNNNVTSNINNQSITNSTSNVQTSEVYQLDTQLSSKTVYLEGMTHSDSQPGLLPLFSSWSLCAIGKYSDYSVHNGLTQPGFLNAHNYLVPWDIHLKNDSKLDKKKLKYLSNSLNKKSGKGFIFFINFASNLIYFYFLLNLQIL